MASAWPWIGSTPPATPTPTGTRSTATATTWPWRDWVINAFNRNLPYDQFITEQLAGDLLPDPTDDQILATAFNRMHQQKVEGGTVEEEFRVDYVSDRTQTFGTAFLGLTLECAKCHDHKFDPITQKEFYQFFAYFDDIDESGLYSYFTDSTPTPTLLLTDDAAKENIRKIEDAIAEKEKKVTAVAAAAAGHLMRGSPPVALTNPPSPTRSSTSLSTRGRGTRFLTWHRWRQENTPRARQAPTSRSKASPEKRSSSPVMTR